MALKFAAPTKASSFDLVASMAFGTAQATQNEMMQFIMDSLTNDDDLTMYCFPNAYLKHLIKNKAQGVLGGLAKAPENLRLIEVNVSDEGIAIIFETPVAVIRTAQKKAVKEKF